MKNTPKSHKRKPVKNSTGIPQAELEKLASTPKRARGQRGPQRTPTKALARTQLTQLLGTLPRASWLTILEAQPASSPGGKLLALMTDPGFARVSLGRLCAEAGLDFAELSRIVAAHHTALAVIEAAEETRDVVMGNAADAKPQLVVCDMCYGDSTVLIAGRKAEDPQREIACPKCGGAGQVRKPGDMRAKEMHLKLVGALEEERGPLVQLNQQFNLGAQHASAVTRGQQLLTEGRKLANSQGAHSNSSNSSNSSREE